MFALFKLLFIVILAIIFYVFIALARLTQKAGNFIAGNNSNTVSSTYQIQNVFDNLFLEFIKIVRDYKLCGSRQYSLDETVIAICLYFYFVSTVYFMLKIEPQNTNVDVFLQPIIRYIKKHQYVLKFQYSSKRLFNFDFYTLTIANIRSVFLSANEKFQPVLKIQTSEQNNTIGTCKNESVETILIIKQIYSTIVEVVSSELEYYHKEDEIEDIFLLRFSHAPILISELTNMSLTFVKNLVYSAMITG